MVIKNIEKVIQRYPMFKLTRCEDGNVFIGQFTLNHVFNDVRMTGEFDLEITVSNQFPTKIPIVRELSGCIADDYPHRYENGQLCLASDLELKMFFSQESDICSFIEKYIVPYLYTYRYYEEYDVYPFGERSHGVFGNLEYLKELFGVDEWDVLFDIVRFISQSSYRGHLACPCGSGKRIRNCHGNVMKIALDAKLENECKMIMEEVIRLGKEYMNGKYNKAIGTV